MQKLVQNIGLRAAAVLTALALLAVGMQAGGLATALLNLHRQSTALAEAKSQLAQMQREAGPLTGPLGRMRQAIERKRIFDDATVSPATLLSLLAPCAGEAKFLSLDWAAASGDKEEMTLRLALPSASSDDANEAKAATVAAFNDLSRQLAGCAMGYETNIIRAPYPNLSGDTVSAGEASGQPIGEISFTRSAP